MDWSITDTTKGGKDFGRNLNIEWPILEEVFLRNGDLLINMLIMELRRQDGIDKKRSFKLAFKLDRTKQSHLATYDLFE